MPPNPRKSDGAAAPGGIPLPDDLPRLAARKPESHKGDFGRVLLVGGAVGMSGAVALAGMAALRSGAGLVSLLVPAASHPIVAAMHPCYMCHPLEYDTQGRLTADSRRRFEELLEQATVVGVGPGWGRSPEAVWMAIRLFRTLTLPVVVDADALNALSTRRRPLADAAGPRIVTPHPGEFTRLTGTAPPREQQEQRAQQIAKTTGCTVVLKGHRTMVADGQRIFRNTTGNPGMATGGTGDVLTGVLTALVAQGLSTWDAARLGVFVHGLAGDLAARRLGQISVTASDVIDALPAAFGCVAPPGVARSAEGASQP